MKTITTRTRTHYCALLVLASGLAAAPGRADVDVAYELSAGVANTNNINRSAEDGLDETAAIAGVALDIDADTRSINGTIDLDVEHRVYTKDTNDDETLGSLNANFQFDLIDRILTWQIADSFGQVLNDIFAPDNPQNREDVNVFSTGPIVSLPLNATNQIRVSAFYRDVSFEDSPQNNNGLNGELSYVRNLSANRTLSLNASSATTDFDREIDPDFDRQAATVTFASRTSRSSLDVELGYNRVNFDGDRDELDGSVIVLGLGRDLTSRLRVSFNYSQQLTDSGQLFTQFLGDRNIGNAISNPALEQNAVADALEQRTGGVTLTSTQRNGNVTAAVRFFDFDFDVTDVQDREGFGVNFGASRDLPSGWRVGANFGYTQNDFADGRSDDNLFAQFTVGKQLTRTLSLNFLVTHGERDSTVGIQSFDDDTVRMTLVWQPRNSRSGG
ncbi:MAG: hypothetical protein AAFN07_01955 [Pseudomonadota bacterium]